MEPMTWIALASAVAGAAKGGMGPPPAPSNNSSDPFFGSLLSNFDTSGWSVNFGTGSLTATTGDRGGPTQTNTPNISKAGDGGVVVPSGVASSMMGGVGSYMPWLMVFGGAAALILLWKHR